MTTKQYHPAAVKWAQELVFEGRYLHLANPNQIILAMTPYIHSAILEATGPLREATKALLEDFNDGSPVECYCIVPERFYNECAVCLAQAALAQFPEEPK